VVIHPPLREHLRTFLSRQVPSLEHNNEIRGESLDLIRYIDSNFDGPALLPEVRLIIHPVTFNAAKHSQQCSGFRLSQSRGCAKLLTLGCVGFLQDAAKRHFADELISYADAFTKALYSPLMAHADVSDEVGK
jgi:glutathione S-transferase